MAVVTATGLTKTYSGTTARAVDGIDFTVADGEFLVLVGPSGCGKSTVLRMIAGLEPISAGTLAIDGVVVNHVPAKARDIAMVFQSYALYPHMSVYDNIAFGLRRRKIDRGEIDRRTREAGAKLGLTELMARKPHALSGGQRQRVALGRAIVRDPQVFLFDEPLSNLDAALRTSTRNELIRQQREIGTTSIFVTHDQVEAMTMGDRICVMNKGRIVQIGRPLDVYREPADIFVAGFIGSPPMNLIEVRLTTAESGREIHLGQEALALPERALRKLEARPDGKIILGIRPEDITLAQASGGLAGDILAVEALGAETLLTLSLANAGIELVLRAERNGAFQRGDNVGAVLDLRAAHFFDPATGKAIR